MTLNLFFHALWMLSGIGAAVCAAETRRARDVAIFGAAFVAASVWLGPQRPPDPAWIGGLAAIGAAHRLAWPARSAVIATVGGVLTASWGALMHIEGLPPAAAIVAAAALAGVTGYLAVARPVFAPAVLREEALMALLLIAIVVAIAPGVITGWSAAQTLNLPDRNTSAPMVPSWVVAVGGGAVFLGGVHRLWSRR